MRIQVPGHFEHAGQLPGGGVRFDPRDAIPEGNVVIDFRYCEFVRPPGALWCLIYALLVRRAGGECVLLVPENIGVARYLQTIGLFDLLKSAGTKIDDRGVAPTDPGRIGVQLQCFQSEQDVDDIANSALDHLNEQDLGAPNLRSIVAETFAELGANAVQHSYGMIQISEELEADARRTTLFPGTLAYAAIPA